MYRKAALITVVITLLFTLTKCHTSRLLVTGDPSGRTPSAIREFRAAWVATVANINWPDQPGMPVEEQKKDAIELLDLLSENNFNAVIFQVRPQCDALYKSDLEPWSYYLTGEQGKAPEPFYDPLEFWIDEAHKRGLELHAWLNPYRAHHVSGGPLTETSIVKSKPGLALFLERGYWWLDPALKGTQDHSYSVVIDLVRRYDLDGIHFDDYFYPYPDYNNFKDFPDEKSWQSYLDSGGKLSRSDWRRKNVNDFIKRVYEGIKAEKPFVKFGLSPFGIWRPYNPPSISGFDQHEVLYADARLWLNKGWIDYYTPQLYWPTGQLAQSYPVLLGWWSSENKKGRHLWPGINIGRFSGDKAIDETISQIMISRGMLPQSPGVVHWSIGPLVFNPLLANAIAKGPYEKEALVPPSPWLSHSLPDQPLVKMENMGDSVRISWNNGNEKDIAKWVIYKKYGASWKYSILGNETANKILPSFEIDKEALLSMDPGSMDNTSEVLTPLDSVAVSAVDRYGNESQVSEKLYAGVSMADAPGLGELRASYVPKVHPYEYKEIEEKRAFEISEYFIPAEELEDLEEENLKKEIIASIERAKEAGANSIFLKVSNIDTTLFDVPGYAVEKAREGGLKIFLVITPLKGMESLQDLPFPEIKRSMKDEVSRYVSKYNIDGLGFEVPVFNLDDTTDNIMPINDLLEDAVVEAMLLKPYLLSAVINNQGSVVPYSVNHIYPQQVVGLNFSDYFSGEPGGQTITLVDEERTKITDSEGSVGFIGDITDTIRLETTQGKLFLSTERWSLPYDYVVIADDTVSRLSPWVEFRRMPRGIIDVPEFDLLCKTDYPARVMINGQEVKQYKTGIFFKTVKLLEGVNRVRATIVTDDSLSTFYEREFIYRESDQDRPPLPLWIDGSSFTPGYDTELLQDDVLPFSFTGSLGQEARLLIIPADMNIRCSVTNNGDYSVYQADIPLNSLEPGKRYSILVKLSSSEGSHDRDSYEVLSPYSFYIRDPDDFPLVMVSSENSSLTYNLGAPRLGGPLRSEPPPGTVFKVNGRFGENYRVRLSNVESGFININDVKKMPEKNVRPTYYITNMSCAPSSEADILSIPYLEPVPFEIHPDPSGRRIIITLFGVETSSTWISHASGLRIINMITWEQSTPETYRVYVNLKADRIWGYDLKVVGQRLVLRIKYPPEINTGADKPLSGLKIAIEAGHGGISTGAIGLSGLLEKDINLDLSFRLGKLCKQMGAEVIQIRDSDIDMSLIEKRKRAVSSGADMLISIHANAGGRGYLEVDGTSTYYHNPFWAPLAEAIYNRLLELGLDEFGIVGSFNYTVTRMSQMPAILVEQAFMSHAEDEEKLANPDFRQQIAVKICQGINDYLK